LHGFGLEQQYRKWPTAVFRSWLKSRAFALPSKFRGKRRICNMREYEVTVVLKSDLDDETRAEVLARVEGWLTQGEGEAAKPSADHWGQRRLAYEINGYTEGYYVFYQAELQPAKVGETERNILYVDEILRHLIVRKEA
jgi:small subunit ribosomal protein S6